MTMQFPKPDAIAIVAGGLASLFDPGEAMTPAQWAAKYLVVPDGPRAGEKFDPALTPYLVEPLNFFSDACPDNKAVVRKSKQTGFTTLAICACGYTADKEPCDVFLIEPTTESLADFIGEKLQRAIDGSPALRKKISAQKSRSSKGSTLKSKKYPGGTLLMGVASSSADLRGKTRRKVIRDEVDEYEDDLAGQGSPHDMITGAYESFLASGDYKDLAISTPTIKGDSYVDDEFEAGDQRYWHVTCPGCADKFYFKWDAKEFRFNKSYPYQAHYVAPCCGAVIESWQRDELVRAGVGTSEGGEVLGWIATAPAPGKHRSYHFDALSSPFVPWDIIAKRIVDAGDNQSKLKTLNNLTFGRAHEMKGSAPNHKALKERAEQTRGYQRFHVPPRGLLLTAFADVQMRGIWLEVVAHAPNRESWPIDAQYLDGDTSSLTSPVWDALREALNRDYPDAFGRMRKIDALGVDSGYRAHIVYAFVRKVQRLHPDTGRDVVLATKGLKGWGRPALGAPSLVDVDLDGKKIKDGCRVWGIGTWSIKGQVTADLYLEIEAPIDGAPSPTVPDGYCHFPAWLVPAVGEEYFKQITAESLQEVVRGKGKGKRAKGRPNAREWVANGPNHFFDCRVGNVALAEYLGLSTSTAEDWAALARKRGLPDALTTVDLFTAGAAIRVVGGQVTTVVDAPIATPAPVEPSRGERDAVDDRDLLAGHDFSNWS